MLSKGTLLTRLILLIGILVLINVVSCRFHKRLDFTGDKRYTLSQPTKDILRALEEPLTVKAYFSEDLPPQIGNVRKKFKETLIEYKNLSNGLLNYEFINPNESQELETEAQQAGIPPQMLRMRESDQLVQKRVYMGAQFLYGDQTEVLPSVPPDAAMEYALSSLVKKMAVKDKATVGFVQGHSEPSLGAMQQALGELQVLYNLNNVDLNDTSFINQCKTLAIVAPKDSFSLNELNNLDAFLAQGKGLYIGLNRVDANLQTATGTAISTGLEQWLANKGIVVEENFVLDQKCGTVSVRQQRGFFVVNQPIPFPYIPIVQNFADHPITKGIESVSFPFASPISIQAQSENIAYTPLAYTSSRSTLQSANTQFDVGKEWKPSDFTMPKQTVGVVAEGNLTPNINSKIVVFGDGDFAINGEGQAAQALSPNNISLMVNSIDWLSDDTGLNELRTKVVTSRPLKAELTDNNKFFIKILNFLLPIALILLYGAFRWMRNKARKRKWESERYA